MRTTWNSRAEVLDIEPAACEGLNLYEFLLPASSASFKARVMATKPHGVYVYSHVETPPPGGCAHMHLGPSVSESLAGKVIRVTMARSPPGSSQQEGPGHRPPPGDQAVPSLWPSRVPGGRGQQSQLVQCRAVPSLGSCLFWKPLTTVYPSLFGVLCPRSPLLGLCPGPLERSHWKVSGSSAAGTSGDAQRGELLRRQWV